MTSFKLAFRYERRDVRMDSEAYKTQLKALLDSMEIHTTRIYNPSYNSIKVIFPTENELNKVMGRRAFCEQHGYIPKISMALKATRTVFCLDSIRLSFIHTLPMT